MVELNVKQQILNVASTPFVQKAWKDGQELRVHGLVYDLDSGRLINLESTMYSFEQVPDSLRLY